MECNIVLAAPEPESPLHFIAIRRRTERIGRRQKAHVCRNARHGECGMRQTFIAAAAAFVAGGIATGAVLSQAQPAPPPAEQVDGGPPRPGMMGPPPHGGMM